MRAIFLTISIALLGCPSDIHPVSPTPPVIEDSNLCAPACEHLQKLGCDEGKPVASGVECVGDHDCRAGDQCINRVCHSSCEAFCRDVQAWGVWLQPRCVMNINFCGEIDSCNQ